jgi:hypothetical protein
MRETPEHMMPVYWYYCHMFFSALRDSFQPEPEIRDDHHRRTKFDLRRRIKETKDAREFIRDWNLASNDQGDGFGHIYETLRWWGTINVHPETFMSGIEELWGKIDADPAVGHRLTRHVMQQAMKHGIEDVEVPEYFWREFSDEELEDPRDEEQD